jgi:uncharacterized secreted repeat protein (TIGR03808 family)
MFDRRTLLSALVACAAPAAARAAQPISALGLDASHFGVRPGSTDDQSAALQRALDDTARRRLPLALAPGVYRASGLKLASGAQLVSIRGATQLVLASDHALFEAQRAETVTLSGLVLDGQNRALRTPGLVHLQNTSGLRLSDCRILAAGANAIHLQACNGDVTDCAVVGARGTAIHSNDASGLIIARNTVAAAGDNGIQVWRSAAGDDGSIVSENRITGVRNRSGGSGQYGNGVNIFRAGNVIVRANRISACAFSAVRGNAASNLHIAGNVVTDAGEAALYSEFGFQGAVISGNSVDGAALGISVTNFNAGGRLAVIQGNLVRNCTRRRPAGTDPDDGSGIGIYAEADTSIGGNVVETASTAAMMLGFGPHLRDVAATGNVLRRAPIGIAVSVSRGAGATLIANNLLSNISRAAIAGMDRERTIGGDLLAAGAARYPHLTLSDNRRD